MRHRKSGRKLNRNASHRKALLKNLAIALVDKEIIKTTVPKAKELKKFLEPIITISKQDSVANRRRAFDKYDVNRELRIARWNTFCVPKDKPCSRQHIHIPAKISRYFIERRE